MTSRTGRPWTRTKARVIRRDHGICHLCGRPGADSADHLTPVAHGGSVYAMGNLAAAHSQCNKIRGVKSIEQARAVIAARTATHAPTQRPPTWDW